MEIVIDIPCQPVAKGRPRFSTIHGYVQTHTPAKTKIYEAIVRAYAEKAMGGAAPLGCPLYVKVYLYLEIPASWSKHKKELALSGELLPTGKPDKDNFEKALFDALNGVVWLDDCQITDSFTNKRYALLPMARIVVRPISAYAANQNPNKERPHYGIEQENHRTDAARAAGNSEPQRDFGLVSV
jgi:Holliday junction resolvase RusA-like endonuclease